MTDEAKCHCSRALKPDHFPDIEDMHEQHATRCCGCVDSFLFGAPDCEACDTAGDAA